MLAHVELEVYSGPLEILLNLVQSEEIPLTRVRLAQILDQVLGSLKADSDLHDSGDLIIVLSTLMELKSKLLLPGDVDLEDEIAHLKEDLLEKLIVHRRLAQVLDALEYRLQRKGAMFARPGLMREMEEVLLPLEGQDPSLLLALVEGVRDWARTDTFRMDYVLLPIEHYFTFIEDLAGSRDFTLFELARERRDALDLAGLLVALLEMVRLGRLEVATGRLGEDVHFRWRAPGESEALNSESEPQNPAP